MSIFSKLGFLVSGFSVIIMTASRYIIGAWHPFLYIFLFLFVVGILVSFILDYKFYLDFFSMKTTKNGLSLGWSFILLIVLLTVFSYFSHRINKTIDLTSEGINSLAAQTKEILETFDDSATVYIFYKGDKLSQKTMESKQRVRETLLLYKQESSKIKSVFIDTYKNTVLADEYLKNLPDKTQEDIFVFVKHKDKKVRVEPPFSEEKITSALIKAKKVITKEIYFLRGHGERDLNDAEPNGLKIFTQSLLDSGFIARSWNIAINGAPPSTPALVLIVGPRRSFLDAEIQWLKEYLSQKKGRVIIALDPKENHNLKGFLRDYGIIFKDDFILSQVAGVLYGGYTKALGVVFDGVHPITKKFYQQKQDLVMFERASSLDVIQDPKKVYSYLVKSHASSFSVPVLTKQVAVQNPQSFNMAIEVSSSKQEKSEEDFRLLVFGDSDFLSNRYFYSGVNKDLILNSIAFLLGEEELITIRPKQPKGTQVELNRYQKTGLVIFMVCLPLIFLILGLFLWYRRREA